MLTRMNAAFQTWGASGILRGSSDGVSSYRLELSVPLEVVEGDALVASLATDRAASLSPEEEVVGSLGLVRLAAPCRLGI